MGSIILDCVLLFAPEELNGNRVCLLFHVYLFFVPKVIEISKPAKEIVDKIIDNSNENVILIQV